LGVDLLLDTHPLVAESLLRVGESLLLPLLLALLPGF